MLRYNLFVLFIIVNVPLLGMYQPQQQLIPIPNKPEYKELEQQFGAQSLSTALYNYQNNNYSYDHNFQKWSLVADQVIGRNYVEEQRRYFLVNVMLHTQQNVDGLDILHDSFLNKDNRSSHDFTPQGLVHPRLDPWQYTKAMKVSNDIRTQLFTGRNINSLVLVQKPSDAMPPEVKWSLFKGVAVVSYLISLCLEKEDKEKDKKKKPGSPLFSLFALTDILQKVEEDIQQALERSYPVLKDYEVKSLVDDKTSWLYDRKNWIFCGSISCMALLLLCIFRDKVPYVGSSFAVVVVV